MYEFMIHYLATGEVDFLYAHSANDLPTRYPNIDPSTYVIVDRFYVD